MSICNELFASLLLISPFATNPCIAQDIPESRMLETPEYRVFEDGVTARGRVRVNYYKGSDSDPWAASPGQVSIEYGLPVWKSDYDALFQKLPVGKRWRLGSNYWTNLSTSFSLKVGEQEVRAGYYYLVLERSRQDQWSLVLLDPGLVTKLELDPWHVNLKDSGAGIRLALRWEQSKDSVEKLQITLKVVDSNPKQVVVHIRFGRNHFWSAPLTALF